MTPSPPTVRLATEADIPSLLPLVITSFRQFPLFDYIYSPLNTNLELLHDTIFHWTVRFLVGLLDPGTEIVIAEVPHADSTVGNVGENEEVRKSREALKWLESNGMEKVEKEGMIIVGWAIWQVRLGRDENANRRLRLRSQTSEEEEKMNAIIHEVTNHNTTSPRRDQDPQHMEAFREAESLIQKRFYTLLQPTLYLDGLCVDFRYQRRGIGKELLRWGLHLSRAKRLDVWTEASPMGLGLYLWAGFKVVGEFVVGEKGDGEGVRMPVLKLNLGDVKV